MLLMSSAYPHVVQAVSVHAGVLVLSGLSDYTLYRLAALIVHMRTIAELDIFIEAVDTELCFSCFPEPLYGRE